MKSFYETLDIEQTATQAEIKKAYKAKAVEMHPDKNDGEDSQFKELVKAYETLSDEDKRAHYDQFGEAKESRPNPVTFAVKALEELIRRNPDNIQEEVENMHRHSLLNINSEITVSRKHIETYKAFLERVEAAPENNFILYSINEQISAQKKKIADAELAKETVKEVIELYKQFTFKVNETQPPLYEGGNSPINVSSSGVL